MEPGPYCSVGSPAIKLSTGQLKFSNVVLSFSFVRSVLSGTFSPSQVHDFLIVSVFLYASYAEFYQYLFYLYRALYRFLLFQEIYL